MTDRDLAVMIKKADCGNEIEKRALWGKLLVGGLILTPMVQAWLKQQKQKAFMGGATSWSNMMAPMMYANAAPMGALGVPQQYRSRMDLQPLSRA